MTCALPRWLCPRLHCSTLHWKPLKLHVTDRRLAMCRWQDGYATKGGANGEKKAAAEPTVV